MFAEIHIGVNASNESPFHNDYRMKRGTDTDIKIENYFDVIQNYGGSSSRQDLEIGAEGNKTVTQLQFTSGSIEQKFNPSTGNKHVATNQSISSGSAEQEKGIDEQIETVPEITSGSEEEESDGVGPVVNIPTDSDEVNSVESAEDKWDSSSWMSSDLGPTAFPRITGNFSFHSGQFSTKLRSINSYFVLNIVAIAFFVLAM